jgi:hypothetical protein
VDFYCGFHESRRGGFSATDISKCGNMGDGTYHRTLRGISRQIVTRMLNGDARGNGELNPELENGGTRVIANDHCPSGGF